MLKSYPRDLEFEDNRPSWIRRFVDGLVDLDAIHWMVRIAVILVLVRIPIRWEYRVVVWLVVFQKVPLPWLPLAVAAAVLVVVKTTASLRAMTPPPPPATEPRQQQQQQRDEETRPNEYHVFADASDRHTGGVILKNGDNNKPVGFYNRKLRGDQKKLTAGEKELLGIAEMLRSYRATVFGRDLVVHTDHRHLLYGGSQTPAIAESRALLEEYRVRYKAYGAGISSSSSSCTSSSSYDSQPSELKKPPPPTTESKKPKTASVGSDEHPGMEGFRRWCESEASLYRKYTFVSEDPSVPPITPRRSGMGSYSFELEVTNLTDRAINVFWIDRNGRRVPEGTIPSQGSWMRKPPINISKW